MTELPPVPSDPAALKAWVENLSRGELMALALEVTRRALTGGFGMMGEFGPPDDPARVGPDVVAAWHPITLRL